MTLRFRRTLAPNSRRPGKRSQTGFLLIALGLLLSLGGLVRVSALPAEARVQETWFAYSQELSFDYMVQVTPEGIYPSDVVAPADLLRIRVPVEPPVYRRVLLSQLTDSITVKLPYRLTTDRPVTINASYRVDGVLTVTNLWQRPYPLLDTKTVSVTGTELALNDLTVTIPIKSILQELDRYTESLKLGHDQAELKIRPIIKVEIPDQREPISASLAPEFTISVRGTRMAIEVDEPKRVDEQQSFTTTLVTPLTVRILWWTLPLNAVRTGSIVALTMLALVLAGMLAIKWVKGRLELGNDLSRLGSALIVAKAFELPADVVLVELQSVSQLLSIHLRADRPVVQVGDLCYLVDGTTCYRLRVQDAAKETAV
jgi:hypothetical protein